MRQFRFAFFVSEKARSRDWAETLALGARVYGDTVDTIPYSYLREPEDYYKLLADYDGGGILGLSRAAKRTMQYSRERNKYFLFFDKGYFGRNVYWRVSIDAWQPVRYFQRFMRPPDRFEATLTPIAGRRSGGETVLFAATCQNYANMMDLGNVNDYNRSVVEKLRAVTNRPIIYRPNPSWFRKHYDEFRPIEGIPDVTLSDSTTTFDAELERAHLVVTHGSGVALGALLSGVPMVDLGESIAKSLSSQIDVSVLIEEPYWPTDKQRQQLCYDAAYCQWRIEEYRSGAAWEQIRLVLNTDDDSLVQQYKIMHEHPRYFRGLSTVQYADKILELVASTGSTSLLDYGSGKGDQYKPPHDLHTFWGLEQVICYDPAVEQHRRLPKGAWDGVICCDVMEHIPVGKVPMVLDQIISRAHKFAFFGVAVQAATKNLPDGRNCHLTVEPVSWWAEQVREAIKRAKKPSLRYVVTTSGADDD